MNVFVEVYGCTANKSDASLIKGLLVENGFDIVSEIDDSDVVVILTCTVIGTTEQRMLSRLRVLNKTNKQVIVGGCMASVQADLVRSVIPRARLLPAQYSSQIVSLINDKKLVDESIDKTGFCKCYDEIVAPVSIAEGCNYSCSYCITTLARGNSVSFPVKGVVEDVKSALKQGCKEIQITSQDTAAYHTKKGENLGDLLLELCKIQHHFRMRLGMMNPYSALINLDSIIPGFSDSKLYKFLHLPVQSGNNKILYSMNRKYIVDDFKKIVHKFKSCFENLCLSTDVIIGFPGESDQQFQDTINLLEDVKPDIVNITRFSPRPFTKSKLMKNKVSTDIMKERSRILSRICSRISKEVNEKYVGKQFSVLVTEKGKNNTFISRSENYKPVVIKDNVELGGFYPILIEKAESTYLVGKLI